MINFRVPELRVIPGACPFYLKGKGEIYNQL